MLFRSLLTTFDRDRVMLYDALLITVTALAAYGIARGPVRTRWDDRALLAMTCAGVAVDVLLLASMVDRTTGLGVSPNRLAATGLNVVLLVNLGVIAVLQWRMLRGRGDGPARWLGNYLGVLAAWAAVVAFAFPVVFAGQ